ncbi:hypothetical protein Tco_1298781 [Tanacetum coccineum]
MQNSITLIAKYFTKIYKPTNNNLRNSSNSRNKNVDSKPRTVNDRQTGQKPKRVKDYSYHKEKMMLCKQEERIKEVLHVTDDNSRPTYDTAPLEQVQTDNKYHVFAKDRQHSEQPESINDTYVMETVDSNVIPDHSDMCNNEFDDYQNADDNDENERVELANLIANLKLDIDENKRFKSN